MNISNIKISNSLTSPEEFDFYFETIYQTISQLKEDYPDFNNWYYKKVRDGIIDGSREIIFTVAWNYIAGVAILKKEKREKKICTLRVFDNFQRNGIGKKLVIESFDYLHTEEPLITVPSLKEHQFQKMFNFFGFKKRDELSNYYSFGKKEVTFNGSLEWEKGSSLLLTLSHDPLLLF